MMIDHITVASPHLHAAQLDLARAGLDAEYGGVHSSGKTHMSLCAFKDGSYLEIVSPYADARTVPLWHNHCLAAHGGTAWTIEVQDVALEITRAREHGVDGHGPVEIRRSKPCGEEGRWELGYLGSGQPGATLPFLIHDFTSRLLRARPNPRFDGLILGWSFVVLAVYDIERYAHIFSRLYGWNDYTVEGEVLHFKDSPVCLSSPNEFLRTFGEAPYCAVLRPAKIKSSLDTFRFRGKASYLGREVRWLDLAWPHCQIGVEVAE